MPRNVNLIYYPDGGCTRRPTGLDGSAGQPRWVQPSLTPPTGRDPLGSRLSVVGRERDEDGEAAEAGVLMRVWRIYAWAGVVIDCAMTQIGPVLQIHGIQSSNCIIKKCEPVRSWHWATLCRNARFPLDEAGRLVTSRTEIENFRSVPERSWLLAGTVCGTKHRMGTAQVDSS